MELKKSNFFSVITQVEENSIAQELGIEVGDILVSINDKAIEDIIEYEYLTADEYLSLEIMDKSGQTIIYDIEKDYDEDLGLTFENPIMNKIKTCSNNCIFCFIDQLPEGMRDTLYIKDDDSRLSFLQGNYITLTNMKEKDIQKIIDYRISPINISVHTTDENLRIKMLGNRFAGDILEKIKRFKNANIQMNAQIVLVRNVNDKENLSKTIKDLEQYIPQMKSVAIVPVGITKYRQDLPKLEIFDKESSREVIAQVSEFQKYFYEKYGIRYVYLSDEFYVMAEEKFPNYEEYDEFIQLENGVGMIIHHYEEFKTRLNEIKTLDKKRHVSTASGKSAYQYIKHISNMITEKFPDIQIDVHEIKNNYFGETITVTGLITATDMLEQLKNKDLGQTLYIVENMLKSDEDIFLDSITLEEFEKKLGKKVKVMENSGIDFVNKILLD